MSTVTVESSRFGTVDVPAEAVIEFPAGLIGLGGRRFALVAGDDQGAFRWLQSLDDGALALPVTDPWTFFADYEVQLSDDDTARVGGNAADVGGLVSVGGG
jgi:flagellar assembly factor FliW